MYVSNFATGVLNPLPLYPTKCVHIAVLAKGLIALILYFQLNFSIFIPSFLDFNMNSEQLFSEYS